MDGYLTENDMIRLLRRLVKREGSQDRAAKILGVSRPLLSYIFNGVRGIGTTIPNALGYERVIVYRKIKE